MFAHRTVKRDQLLRPPIDRPTATAPSDLDDADRRILRALMADGSLSNNSLAEQVGLTAGPCSRRVSRLEALGIIQGYKAEISPKALGYSIQAYVNVSLQNQGSGPSYRFVAEVLRKLQVVECHLMSGDADFLLKVVAVDIEDFHRFIWTELNALDNVRTVRSAFIIETMAQRPPPLR